MCRPLRAISCVIKRGDVLANLRERSFLTRNQSWQRHEISDLCGRPVVFEGDVVKVERSEGKEGREDVGLLRRAWVFEEIGRAHV